MAKVDIEWQTFETRPRQVPRRIDKGKGKVESDRLRHSLDRIIARTAAAYRIRDVNTVSLKWRRRGMSQAEWASYP